MIRSLQWAKICRIWANLAHTFWANCTMTVRQHRRIQALGLIRGPD